MEKSWKLWAISSAQIPLSQKESNKCSADSAAPSGLKARQGKHLISRQKRCREQFLIGTLCSGCRKNRRHSRKTIREICMQQPFQLVQMEIPKHQTKNGRWKERAKCRRWCFTKKHKSAKRISQKRFSNWKKKTGILCHQSYVTHKFGKKRMSGVKSQPTFLKLIRAAAVHFLVVIICNSYYKRDWKYYNKRKRKWKKITPHHVFSQKQSDRWHMTQDRWCLMQISQPNGKIMNRKDNESPCYFRLNPNLVGKLEKQSAEEDFPRAAVTLPQWRG